jgi:O-antigen ligase
MASTNSRATPLLNAFRAPRPVDGQVAIGGTRFESFLVLFACLIPVAACWYLSTPCPTSSVQNPCVNPLFEFHTVELIHPDLIAGIVVLAVLGRALVKGFHPLPRVLLVPFLIFFAATLLSALFAIDKIHAVAALIQELEFMALAWAFSVLEEARHFLRVLHFILALFVFESLVAIWQFASSESYPTGTFVAHQQYAFYTSFAAVIAFGLLANETNRRRRTLYIVCLSLLVIGSLLGQERAPWLSLLVGAIAVAWYSGKKRKRLLFSFAVTVLGAVLLVAAVPQLREVTVSRFAEAQTDTYAQNSLLSRLLVWGIAFNLFLEHPILGIGPKNFPTVVSHYASTDELMGVEAQDPHNIWIGMAAEQGIVGLATYIVFFFSMIRLATAELRTSMIGLPRSLCLAYLAYFVFWLVMSYSVFFKSTGHIHFMLLGLMLGLRRHLALERSSANFGILAAREHS